jgi:2-oxoglutarate dehydrogenase E1 component
MKKLLFFAVKSKRTDKIINYDIKKKEHILRKLNKAVIFEKFLGTKYIGEKRFSLEGGETTIPALRCHHTNCCFSQRKRSSIWYGTPWST